MTTDETVPSTIESRQPPWYKRKAVLVPLALLGLAKLGRDARERVEQRERHKALKTLRRRQKSRARDTRRRILRRRGRFSR